MRVERFFWIFNIPVWTSIVKPLRSLNRDTHLTRVLSASVSVTATSLVVDELSAKTPLTSDSTLQVAALVWDEPSAYVTSSPQPVSLVTATVVWDEPSAYVTSSPPDATSLVVTCTLVWVQQSAYVTGTWSSVCALQSAAVAAVVTAVAMPQRTWSERVRRWPSRYSDSSAPWTHRLCACPRWQAENGETSTKRNKRKKYQYCHCQT